MAFQAPQATSQAVANKPKSNKGVCRGQATSIQLTTNEMAASAVTTKAWPGRTRPGPGPPTTLPSTLQLLGDGWASGVGPILRGHAWTARSATPVSTAKQRATSGSRGGRSVRRRGRRNLPAQANTSGDQMPSLPGRQLRPLRALLPGTAAPDPCGSQGPQAWLFQSAHRGIRRRRRARQRQPEERCSAAVQPADHFSASLCALPTSGTY